jgi:hypothetical protein
VAVEEAEVSVVVAKGREEEEAKECLIALCAVKTPNMSPKNVNTTK